MSPNLEKYSLRPSVKWKNAAFRNTVKKVATQVESFWKIAFSAKRGHTSWPKSTKPFPLFAFQPTLESKRFLTDRYIMISFPQQSENDSGSPIWSCLSMPTYTVVENHSKNLEWNELHLFQNNKIYVPRVAIFAA